MTVLNSKVTILLYDYYKKNTLPPMQSRDASKNLNLVIVNPYRWTCNCNVVVRGKGWGRLSDPKVWLARQRVKYKY